MAHPAIARAIEVAGLQPLARGLGVSHQAVRKWERAGRLPRTEWTGETSYASQIVRLARRKVTKTELMMIHAADRKAAAKAEA
jgi:hypothetical protein